MTGSHSDVIKAWRKFLTLDHACEDDGRLLSQVQVWCIYSRIQDTFGTNVEALLQFEALPQVRSFVAELDAYRAEWNHSYRRNEHIGDYPNKGLSLHYHFAKLYLCSHVFRGRPTIAPGKNFEFDEIISASVLSATSILKLLASDQEIQSYLNGLPSYFFTMITFASVFLLKMSRWYPDIPWVHTNEIYDLIGQVVTSLRHVSETMHERHLLASIVHGLEKILARLSASNSLPHTPLQARNWSETNVLPETHPALFMSPSDISLWDNYDFLSFQNPSSAFDLGMDFES